MSARAHVPAGRTTPPPTPGHGAATAHVTAADPAHAAAALASQLGTLEPSLLLLFASVACAPSALADALRARFPSATLAGCSTAGEFTEHRWGTGGASLLALDATVVRRAAGALATWEGSEEADVAAAVSRAAAALGHAFGASLRDLDPARHVGLVLCDGLGLSEEAVNHALGMVAPGLSFVGGSAGDDFRFESTWVGCDGAGASRGAALVLLELSVPYTILKTQSVVPTSHVFEVTRADAATRTVYEVNGRPVLEAYAEVAGVRPEALDAAAFMRHPWALVEDGTPWLRSPMMPTADGGLRFACAIAPHMRLRVMRQSQLLSDTRHALAAADARLGGPRRAALLFDCVYRRLELDAADLHVPYRALFGSGPVAGFNSYGESWLGHMNQTCIGLLLG